MKQHITEKQLREISEEDKDKLRKWWNKSHRTEDYGEWTWTTTSGSPLFSIGEMIEFLDEEADACEERVINIVRTSDYEEKGKMLKGEWVIGWGYGAQEVRFENTIFCDALWEAVKEILDS